MRRMKDPQVSSKPSSALPETIPSQPTSTSGSHNTDSNEPLPQGRPPTPQLQTIVAFDPGSDGTSANEDLDTNIGNQSSGPFPLASSTGSSSHESLRDPHHRSLNRSSNPSRFLTAGQAILFNSLFSLADPVRPVRSKLAGSISHAVYELPPDRVKKTSVRNSSGAGEEDPEDVRQIMCKAIIPDANTRDNALPFVLQCYVQWINYMVFLPQGVTERTRDGIIAQFSSSEESRRWTILHANVVAFASSPTELDSTRLSLAHYLCSQTRRHIRRFHTTHPIGEHPTDKRNAFKLLKLVVDALGINWFSGPISITIGLIEAAAPVFRMACSDPPGKLVNLPNILLSPVPLLLNFVSADIFLALATGRPPFFKYDVTCTPEVAKQLMNESSWQMDRLVGLADPFLISLAWISSLYEEYGASVDPEYIAAIEDQVQKVAFTHAVVPKDPSLGIGRWIVRECWRQVVYICLYMLLCGAPADDPRVKRAARAFTQLVDMAKPTRSLDNFLRIPMAIAGVGAYEARDQRILRQRLMSLQEHELPGTSTHEYLSILNDIWKRTAAEKRPAVWRDLRLAALNVVGV